MASKERYFETTTTNHIFRKPELSNISLGEDGETGREFLAVGQKSMQTISSNPEMGAGCITKIECYGRVGVVSTDDGEQSYIYVDADDWSGPLTIEEEMPHVDALSVLEDAEACERFVTDSLVAVLNFSAE